jgi:hypothetical protein
MHDKQIIKTLKRANERERELFFHRWRHIKITYGIISSHKFSILTENNTITQNSIFLNGNMIKIQHKKNYEY